jgi:hypothetical protein
MNSSLWWHLAVVLHKLKAGGTRKEGQGGCRGMQRKQAAGRRNTFFSEQVLALCLAAGMCVCLQDTACQRVLHIQLFSY